MSDSRPTYGEQFRRACEARHVLAMPGSRRDAFLELVRQRRGEEGWRVLMQDLAAVEQGVELC